MNITKRILNNYIEVTLHSRVEKISFKIDESDLTLIEKGSWIIRRNNKKIYIYSNTGIALHRILADTPKGMYTHHVNEDTLDNRKSNLRNLTPGESSVNKKYSSGRSKYRGVHPSKKFKSFTAIITKEGKKYRLGNFKSEIEAAEAYDKAAKELFGEYAYLNFESEDKALKKVENEKLVLSHQIEKESNSKELLDLLEKISGGSTKDLLTQDIQQYLPNN